MADFCCLASLSSCFGVKPPPIFTGVAAPSVVAEDIAAIWQA